VESLLARPHKVSNKVSNMVLEYKVLVLDHKVLATLDTR